MTIDLDLPPGDSFSDAFGAMSRLVTKARRRAGLAQKRWEKDGSKINESGYLLAAQEYYYMSKLVHDFKKLATTKLAELHSEASIKKNRGTN
jgi:hypothetical protein